MQDIVVLYSDEDEELTNDTMYGDSTNFNSKIITD